MSCTAGVQISTVLRKGSIGTSAFADMIGKATSDFFWIKTVGIHQGSLNGTYIDVSENSGTFPPKSSILIGFSSINHPFWGTPIFGNTHIEGIKQYNMYGNCE